jgi:hypothetical protein
MPPKSMYQPTEVLELCDAHEKSANLLEELIDPHMERVVLVGELVSPLRGSDSTRPFRLSAPSESTLSGGIPSLNHDAIDWHRGIQRMFRTRGQYDSGVSKHVDWPLWTVCPWRSQCFQQQHPRISAR